jgi:hypothetical protein
MQGVLVFASEAARDAAITSPQEGQFAFTKDNNSLWYYSGAAWVASGATGDIEGVTAGTGISGGGTSGTVTITNSMATEITAKADLIVGTGNAAFDNLAVGADGTVLTADSTVSPTGLKWAAAAGGGDFVKISSVTWTAANAQSLTSVFSATYDNYCIVLDNLQGSNTNDLCIRMRSGANNDTNSTYYWANLGLGTNNTGYNSNSNGTDTFRTQGLTETPHKCGFIMWIFNPFESVRTSAVWTQMGATSTEFAYNTGGGVFAADTSFDGLGFFLFAGGDLSGDATVYGLKK